MANWSKLKIVYLLMLNKGRGVPWDKDHLLTLAIDASTATVLAVTSWIAGISAVTLFWMYTEWPTGFESYVVLFVLAILVWILSPFIFFLCLTLRNYKI